MLPSRTLPLGRNNRALAMLLLATSLASALPAQVIDLSALGTTHPGFVIEGIDPGDTAGSSVSGAGDVNGDGLADLIVGAPSASPGGDSAAGESYVVFGKTDGVTVDLSALGTGGFRIDGIDPVDNSGGSVSGAGDVNGDGLADLIVGARLADPGGDAGAGESYVVFGKADSAAVDLSALGTGGFRIDGINPVDNSGGSVSGAGDVNGDGRADLIIGARLADPGGLAGAGTSYVVFGKSDSDPVDLAQVEAGTGGFRIDGAVTLSFLGTSVSGAGDVNGDGLADLIVGAPYVNRGITVAAGESYVIFGKTDGGAVNVDALGTGGFLIEGIDGYDYSGRSVSGAGDVNGDGRADLIVGAFKADHAGLSSAGESYVVFGKSDNAMVSLATLGPGGFLIEGINADDIAGFSVSGAGDVNGDGLADLLVGARQADPGGDSNAGESYIIFGKTDNTTVSLSTLGTGGLRIDGIDAADQSGFSVSSAGDANGDGLADMIVGANAADPGVVPYTRLNAGEAYVIFSPESAPPQAVYRGTSKAGAAPLHPIGVSGDGSNNDTPDARVWVGFQNGDIPSQEQVTLIRTDSVLPTGVFNLAQTADVVWQVTTNRTGWSSASVKFKYTDAEIAGLDEASIRLYKAQSTSGPWVEVPSTVDAARNQVTATVSSFSYFALSDAPIDDGDGIAAAIEDAGPNGGDGNGDGIPDSQQSNVASLPNGAAAGPNAGQYLTLASPPNTQLSGVGVFPAFGTLPPGVLGFPVGLVSFQVSGALQPYPAPTVVTLIAEQAPSPLTSGYFKFNAPDYTPFDSPVLPLVSTFATGAVFDGNRTWTITLTDDNGTFPYAQSGDLDASFGLIVDPGGPAASAPLAVSLSSFTATATPTGVRLDWTTVAESNNAGFNVYRSESPNLVKLNATPIGAEGLDGAGASYSYLDGTATTGSYYLEDVDLNGTKTLHGPVTAAASSAVPGWMMY